MCQDFCFLSISSNHSTFKDGVENVVFSTGWCCQFLTASDTSVINSTDDSSWYLRAKLTHNSLLECQCHMVIIFASGLLCIYYVGG